MSLLATDFGIKRSARAEKKKRKRKRKKRIFGFRAFAGVYFSRKKKPAKNERLPLRRNLVSVQLLTEVFLRGGIPFADFAAADVAVKRVFSSTRLPSEGYVGCLSLVLHVETLKLLA